MNASERIEELLKSGWRPYMAGPVMQSWLFFYRTNKYDFFTDYLTVFPNGRVLPGIIKKRRKIT